MNIIPTDYWFRCIGIPALPCYHDPIAINGMIVRLSCYNGFGDLS